jgi:hypothetical protein
MSRNGGRFAVGCSVRIDRRASLAPQRLEFFSLGGVLSILWRPPILELPWVVAAASLVLLSCWDVFKGAGRVDFILIGLAAYELLIGLTEEKGERVGHRSYG